MTTRLGTRMTVQEHEQKRLRLRRTWVFRLPHGVDSAGDEWRHYRYDITQDVHDAGPATCGICGDRYVIHGWMRTQDTTDVVCEDCVVLQ